MSLIPAVNCSNQYTCPGGGTGYGIQFNIVPLDINTLLLPPYDASALTVDTATSVYNKSLKSIPPSSSPSYSAYSKSLLTDEPVPLESLTWWYNSQVLGYKGKASLTPMDCIPNGAPGFAIGLATAIVNSFGISGSRICNAVLKPSYSTNDVDITTIKFTFYINDIVPANPLWNDYLPSSCVGTWIM